MKKSRLSLIVMASLLFVGTSVASATFSYSSWGHKVTPVGSGKTVQAFQWCQDGNGCIGYISYWFQGSSGTSAPGGNTWTATGGYCGTTSSNAVWAAGSWMPPSTGLGAASTVTCPSSQPRPYGSGNTNAYVEVASEGYSSFTY